MVKISPMGRIFKFMVLRLLENVFVSRKNESFYSSSHAPEQTPSRFLLSHPQGERYYTFPPGSFFFWKSWYFFPDKKGRARNLWPEKIIKINLCWYWSQVLINPTFFVFVLLCHNLDSGMLKCKDFNTTKKKSTKKVYRNNCMKDEMLPYPIF